MSRSSVRFPWLLDSSWKASELAHPLPFSKSWSRSQLPTVALVTDIADQSFVGSFVTCRFCRFQERRSKNNEYNENRTNENQFRTTYYSYEPDFVLTVKQYLRHLPELVEDVSPDLFLQAIGNPASIVWNNRKHKVSQERCGAVLKNMLTIVGLPPTLIRNYRNKSGRATLVTRMAARGVPDESGMLVTGHHTTSGYANYDRTGALKQEVGVLLSGSHGLTYDPALKKVSKNFVKEKVVGMFDNLNPLMDSATTKRINELKRSRESEQDKAQKDMETYQKPRYGNVGESSSSASLQLGGHDTRMQVWHEDYDRINWELEFKRNPALAKALGGSSSQVSNVANHMAGIYSNCNITIQVVQPGQVREPGKPVGSLPLKGKENQPLKGKENQL